jgi:phosphatidylinositol glycan class V
VKQLLNFLLASPVLSLAVYSIVHYTKLLHRLFQTTSIHKQIITALEERPVVSYRRSDDVTSLSELSARLTKKAQGTIAISTIYILLCFEKLLLIYLDVKSI